MELPTFGDTGIAEIQTSEDCGILPPGATLCAGSLGHPSAKSLLFSERMSQGASTGGITQLRRATLLARIEINNPKVRYPEMTCRETIISPPTPLGVTSPKPSVVKVTMEK